MAASSAIRSVSDKQPSTGPETRTGSVVHLDHWVSPDIADERGLLRAGKILEWMDVVGVLAATRHCQRPVVTASVDGLDLLRPVRVGDRLSMTAAVAHTSARSVGVGVTVRHVTPDAEPRDIVQGYMTFVALDRRNRAASVPQFEPQTPEEHERFREGALRRELRQKLASGPADELPPPETADEGAEPEAMWRVRELLKWLPGNIRLPRDRDNHLRTRRVSFIHTIEPVRTASLNFHGTLYGGELMRWLETTASLSARAYLRGAPVELEGLHGLTFIHPVRDGYFVHLRCVVVHTDARTLTVLVNVGAEDPAGGTLYETVRALLTYRAGGGVTRRIPKLPCSSDAERSLFSEAEHRIALQRTLRQGRSGDDVPAAPGATRSPSRLFAKVSGG